MDTTTYADDQLRDQARNLYKQLEACTAKNQAAIQADLQQAAAQAQTLASALKALAKTQRVDAAAHMQNAASLFDETAATAKTAATAAGADLHQMNLEMLERTRDALQQLSEAVAARRSAAAKQPA